MSSPPSTKSSSTSFEALQDDDFDDGRRFPPRPSPSTATFLVLLVVLIGVYLNDRYVAHVYLVGSWNVQIHEWVFLFAAIVVVAFGIVPAIRNRDRTLAVLARLRSRPAGVAGAGYVLLMVIVGLFVPLVADTGLRFEHMFHPPIGFTAPKGVIPECAGTVTTVEGEITRKCHGSLTYPLGTNYAGHDMIHLAGLGTRVALIVTVFAVGVIIPLATLVGAVAGYYGGRVDDHLMAYVDVQLSIPAILVYFIAMIYFNPQFWLLLVVFGLFSWGGIARLVRSEVLQRKEEGFVLAAESAGASRFYVVRRHLLPSVTNTVVPAAAHLIAILILTEAGLSFLGFYPDAVHSWGRTIAGGLELERDLIDHLTPLDFWWVSTIPAIALALTITMFKLAGDGLRDALDPRQDG